MAKQKVVSPKGNKKPKGQQYKKREKTEYQRERDAMKVSHKRK